MPARQFYAANVASALVWAPSHILPSVLVGASFRYLGAAAKPLAMLLVVLVVALWATIHAVKYALRRGVPLLMAGLERLRDWAKAHDGRLSRALVSLLDP